MPSSIDLRLGRWYDQTSSVFTKYQYTATQEWTLWMTSFMAAALTLATPFLARILVSLGIWSKPRIARLWRRRKNGNNQADEQALLEGGAPPGYGGTGLSDSTQFETGEVNGIVNGSALSSCDTGTSQPPSGSNAQASEVGSITSVGSSNGSTGSDGPAPNPVSLASHNMHSAQPRHDLPTPPAEANGHLGHTSHAEHDNVEVAVDSTQRTRGDVKLHYIAGVIGILAVVFMLVVGIFAPKIVTDTAGIAASHDCGQWEYDRNASREERLRDFQRSYLKEDRAAQYAQNCYGLSEARLDNSIACERFYRESIKFVEKDAQCPFRNKTVCLETYGAVAYSTGLIPATHLGINTGSTDFKFRRNTTCSPITLEGHWTRNGTRYYYYYGRKVDANTDYTYYTDADVLEWEIPQYSLDVYYYDSLGEGRPNWVPIDDLLPDVDGSGVSLIFVSSHHLWHYEQSNDPIFPATSTSPRRHGWYYNGDLKARPLACVDSTEICAGGECRLMNATTLSKDHAWWLMKLSLERSNTYEAIRHRLGFGLLAQQKISGYWTRGLAPDQWKVEARSLFATSLSRIQWDLWSIATGEDAGARGYKDYTPDEAKGGICKLYKFNKKGYSNINLMAFWSIIVACGLIVVAAMPTPQRFSSQGQNDMLVETLARKVRETSCFCSCCIKRHKRTGR